MLERFGTHSFLSPSGVTHLGDEGDQRTYCGLPLPHPEVLVPVEDVLEELPMFPTCKNCLRRQAALLRSKSGS